MADEAIAAAGERFDKPRVISVVAERFPQLTHHIADGAVEIDEDFFRPKSTADFVAADNITRAVKEKEQNLERLLLDSDSDTVFPELARALIHFKDAELGTSGRASRRFYDTPKTNACGKLSGCFAITAG